MDNRGSLSVYEKEAFKTIEQDSRNLFNRLHSINEDADFVSKVIEAYPEFPAFGMSRTYDSLSEYLHKFILANLRCGAWYTDPLLVKT